MDENGAAMETVAGWAGSRPPREILAMMEWLHNYDFYSDNDTNEAINWRASSGQEKMAKAFQRADEFIRYSRKHPPK